MKSIKDYVSKLVDEGYNDLNAQARVSQDILLKAIKNAGIEENVTIKGGVLIRNISQDERRATIDLDVDFVKYSINDEMLNKFIAILNDNSDYSIEIVGNIEELKHEEYKGKRVFLNISDGIDILNTKVDIGVHTYNEMELERCIFNIVLDDEGISLLANSKEQVITEKLKSLLKFGTTSTRYKDIFDIDFLLNETDADRLKKYIELLIINNENSRYKTIQDIRNRLEHILNDKKYIEEINRSNKNWSNKDINEVVVNIIKLGNIK